MNEETKLSALKNLIHRIAPSARVTVLIAALLAGASGLAWRAAQAEEDTASVTPIALKLNAEPVARDGRGLTSFAPVVKKVTPSVVKVFVTTKARNVPSSDFPSLDDPFFRRFFGDNLNPGRGGHRMQTPREHGLGSGVIVTKDGYILTNNHVVENADEVRVALNDGREMTAKVIGKDPKSDVALLKVDAKDLPAIDLADSDKTEVGDLVLAIGNPFGVGQTVTSGIISAKDRGNLGLDYEDFIQTDAAINPGNSGGALVDAEGRLIGINTAILSRSGGNQGIGFAIPSNLARNVMEGLVKNGHVVRSYLGVNIQDLTPALAHEFDLKNTSGGVVVSDVVAKSPAEKAGFKAGDVITEFNGKTVRDSRHLKLQVAQTAPGTSVPVKVLREGKAHSFDVTLKELPTKGLAANENQDQETSSSDSLKGVEVRDLDSQTRSQINAPTNVKGAVVADVSPDSAAYEAGLRRGDVIEEINRKPVASAEDAVKLTENVKDKKILLRVWGQGGSRFVVVDESKAG